MCPQNTSTSSSYLDVMTSSQTFIGSTLVSGYRSVQDMMSRFREETDTNKTHNNKHYNRNYGVHNFISILQLFQCILT